MQANPIKLLRLLGDSNTIFKIPVYQRNYEWHEEQINQLFIDIEKIVESNFNKSHFLGTIVYVQKEMEDLMNEKVIIDGQQRITTSILLLKSIMDLANMKNDVNPEEIKEKYLINKYASEKSRLRLKPVEADMKAFEELMLNNQTESRIYENYKLLLKKLQESRFSLKKIYKAMTIIDVVYISIDSNENPQVIFESLNSTGLSLTQADLIRNFILMGLDYQNQTRLYKSYWVKIEELLPNAIISDFVRDYLIMKQGKVPKKSKVYESFKEYYIENNYDSEKILNELLIFAKYYYYIINNDTSLEDINNELENINIIRSTVTYPFLLALFDDYYRNRIICSNELLEVLKIIVSYIYRRNMCGIATNALNNIFAVMPREVKKRNSKNFTYVESIVDFLMSRTGSGIFPRNNEFENNFINANMYARVSSLTKFILYRIEEFKHKEVVKIDKLSVEHVLPQELTHEWNLELGTNAYETHNTYKDSIGNLTLTNYNSEMSNKSFSEKKNFYQDSNIKITRDISEYDKCDAKSIIKRSKQLLEVAKMIWFLPKDNYDSISKDRLIANERYSILDNLIVTGHIPKSIILDGEIFNVKKTWKNMLVKTCRYLYELDEELFKSLMNKSNFKNILSYDKDKLHSPKEIKNSLYIQSKYSAKDILNYIVLFCKEFEIEDLVYFEVF